MAIKRRDDRVRLDTILKESTRRKRVLSEYYSGGLGVRELALSLDTRMKPVLVYTVQKKFYKDNIKRRKCDHKENLKS